MLNTVVPFPSPQAVKQGPFKQRPGQYVRKEFLDWVRETGRPDTWQHHTSTKPPADQDFEELDRFVIPEPVRPSVGRATCPICSPGAPKYFAGALAWFPTEGVLRAIGHECAKSHFGTERANAAIAARKHHAAVEGAQDFLMETLPTIAELRAEVDSLQITAATIDHVRQVIWSASSRTSCEKLAKMGASGALSVEHVRAVEAVDAQGQSTTRYESDVVATYSVGGLAFISRRFIVSGLAKQTDDILQLVRAADPEEALEFICTELKAHDHLFQAERLARGAVEQVERLRQAVADAKQFFAPENLISLTEYTRHNYGGTPVHFDFNSVYPARLRVRGPNKKWREVSVPPTLR